MPIWVELLILSLVAYTMGLGLGWALWGRAGDKASDKGGDNG